MSLEEIYVPFDVLPNLVKLDKSEFSMYELYDFYKVELSYARQTLDIVQLKKNEANLLDIPVDQSVFLFKCWTYSGKRLIEYAESYVRADLCDYSVHFGNQVTENADRPSLS
jgi:DNA-binding GntR family transcriptional regulator